MITNDLKNSYRTHNCGELSIKNENETVKLSGWVHAKRDHGGVIFLDLRDHYGLIQLVTDDESDQSISTAELEKIPNESVITVTGKIRKRKNDVERSDIATGQIEVVVEKLIINSKAKNQLPFNINDNSNPRESIRLKNRFLDLRRKEMQEIIKLRSRVCQFIRNTFHEMNFHEVSTPLLTSSSPEGAKDFVIPSRLHPGKFYALPQAPQQFKQLLMASGFDRYFQIAPCFRDEDARADRTPGEFYQLDIEMSFVEQEDILQLMEKVIIDLFSNFSQKQISAKFTRISFEDAMLKYGSDKPDLRNPLVISDVTEIFQDCELSMFVKAIKAGCKMRAIPAPKTSERARSFFDGMIAFAQSNGAKGLAYITFDEKGTAKGPIAKLMTESELSKVKEKTGISNGDSVFFSCDQLGKVENIAGLVRDKVGQDLGLIDANKLDFCWITDFFFFEKKDEGGIDFGHNPFSMPITTLSDLNAQPTEEELLKIKAYQYDLVCNGIELSSGAIRNHSSELLEKVFNIVGYDPEDVKVNFEAMINAFECGIPPHGGIAFGVDRIIMLLTDKESVRDVIAFPMNGQAEDTLMNAPCALNQDRIDEIEGYIEHANEERSND